MNYSTPFGYYGAMPNNPVLNQPAPAQDERIWVQNQTAAEAYLLAPNGFVRLWDSSRPVFYEKRADATGRPMAIEAYEYSRVMPKSSSEIIESEIDYGKEIEALKERISAIENTKRGGKNAKQSVDDDATAQ